MYKVTETKCISCPYEYLEKGEAAGMQSEGVNPVTNAEACDRTRLGEGRMGSEHHSSSSSSRQEGGQLD